MLLVLLVLNGCDKDARYRTLSFFFDGVPHPDAAKQNRINSAVSAGNQNQDKTGAPSVYRHPAVDTVNECAFCHGEGSPSNMVIPPRDMCLRCHTHVKANRPFLHGPATIECVICHDVHKSDTMSLLRKTGNDICFECHYRGNKDEIRKTQSHQKVIKEKLICLYCHDPHGGQDRFFIKDKKIIEANMLIYTDNATKAGMPHEVENNDNETEDIRQGFGVFIQEDVIREETIQDLEE